MLQHEREINAKDEERERLAVLSLVQGQEQEQERIGRELHNIVGIDLSHIKFKLFEAITTIKKTGIDTTQLEQTQTAVGKLNNTILSLSHTMIPDTIIHFGLVATLEEMATLINDSKMTKVVLHAEAVDPFLTDNNKLMLFRVIQELTHNAIKHAKVKVVTIELSQDDAKRVVARISDTGEGFNLDDLKTTQGVGLRNVASRVRVEGGEFALKTAPGFGTVATVTI